MVLHTITPLQMIYFDQPNKTVKLNRPALNRLSKRGLFFLQLDVVCYKQSFRRSFKSLSCVSDEQCPGQPAQSSWQALCKHWRRLDKHPFSAEWHSAQNLTVNYRHNTNYCTNIQWHTETHKILTHKAFSHRQKKQFSYFQGPSPPT